MDFDTYAKNTLGDIPRSFKDEIASTTADSFLLLLVYLKTQKASLYNSMILSPLGMNSNALKTEANLLVATGWTLETRNFKSLIKDWIVNDTGGIGDERYRYLHYLLPKRIAKSLMRSGEDAFTQVDNIAGTGFNAFFANDRIYMDRTFSTTPADTAVWASNGDTWEGLKDWVLDDIGVKVVQRQYDRGHINLLQKNTKIHPTTGSITISKNSNITKTLA